MEIVDKSDMKKAGTSRYSTKRCFRCGKKDGQMTDYYEKGIVVKFLLFAYL